MENKFIMINKNRGRGWNHFKARELHKKNLIKANIPRENLKSEGNNQKKLFAWITQTINPLNHLPVVSSIKKIVTKSNKSLDIIQSAVGGFLFAGPLGILKGIGGWAANKITDSLISQNSEKRIIEEGMGANLNTSLEYIKKAQINNKNSFFINYELSKDDKFNNPNLHDNQTQISNKKLLNKQAQYSYVDVTKDYKSKINISA